MRRKNNLSTSISVFLAIALVMLIGVPNPGQSPYYKPSEFPQATPQPSVPPSLFIQNREVDSSNDSSSKSRENENQSERAECENNATNVYESDFCLASFEEVIDEKMLINYFDRCATTAGINQYDCHCNYPLSGEAECNQNPCMAALEKCELVVEQIHHSCLSLVGRIIDGIIITNAYCSELYESSRAIECEATFLICKE